MDKVLVLNSGDNIDRITLKPIHPCLLPKKRYIYLTSSGAHVCNNAKWWLSLTGLQHAEQQLTGLPGSLTSGQTQDLCGNAFSSNVIASLLLAVLASGLCDKWGQKEYRETKNHGRLAYIACKPATIQLHPQIIMFVLSSCVIHPGRWSVVFSLFSRRCHVFACLASQGDSFHHCQQSAQ